MTVTETPTVAAMPTFINTSYANQRVTLTLIDEGVDKRRVALHPVATFLPQRVGTREEGEHQVPIIHGFWTPRDEAELAAMRHVCAQGYCSAREENASLRQARELLQAEEAAQAAKLGR